MARLVLRPWELPALIALGAANARAMRVLMTVASRIA
jgi:hypothetical protein